MIRGIGVDTVSIPELDAMLKRLTDGAIKRIFSTEELAASRNVRDASEYLATRFAVKEAVYKAVAPLLEGESFDMRMVETRNRADGSPYVNSNDVLDDVLKRAGVSHLLISITTEGNLATAFVIAE